MNELERKTIATQAEEVGIAISRGFDARKKLMRRVGAAVITLGTVLMRLRNRHTHARRLADVQRCAVTAEHFDWRPIWQRWNWRW